MERSDGDATASDALRQWMNLDLSPDQRAEELLAALALEEKVALVSERTSADSTARTRLGIPALIMADGPAGVRLSHDAAGTSTALPAPLALAASWDTVLARQYGDLLGREAHATGHDVLFGPCLDIARTPTYGRLFESFGEDPFLTGTLATHYIRGVQGHPVMACAKHYNLNTQEDRRHVRNAHLDVRTLQELYTLPFAIAIQDGAVDAVMAAYNKVDGVYCCENAYLLTTVLKQQLAFPGWIVSDFLAVHSTEASAMAGLDMELGPPIFFGDALLTAVRTGQVSHATLDEKVRRLMRAMFMRGIFDQQAQQSPPSEAEQRRLARMIAGAGIVLLKNAGQVLPLSLHAMDTLAVIGADADHYIAGGGSALVRPAYIVSMLQGIQECAGEEVRVLFTEGTDPVSAGDLLPGPPPVPSAVFTPDGAIVPAQGHGLAAEYWTNPRFDGAPQLVRLDRTVNLNVSLFDGADFSGSSLSTPDRFQHAISVRWSAHFTAPATGTYRLSLTHWGTARLDVDGERLLEDSGVELGTRAVELQFLAGESHAVRIEYAANRPEQAAPLPGGSISQDHLVGAQIRFGWEHPPEALGAAIETAQEVAARADMAVVFAHAYSCEHFDLPSLTLPHEQDRLIEAVAAVNPRTVVVLATGGPIAMPWIDRVAAVLETWYGGQEGSGALADILFGVRAPSAKLPISFPRDERATPVAQLAYADTRDVVSRYGDRLAVGYRGYDQLGLEPLFPFGHGLSYTSFAYSALEIQAGAAGDGAKLVRVRFTVTNTGERFGEEVAQVYLGMPAAANEPPKRLVGWAKLVLQPGETQWANVVLDTDAAARPMSVWSSRHERWEVVAGEYRVLVGASSRDIRLTGAFMWSDASTGHTMFDS